MHTSRNHNFITLGKHLVGWFISYWVLLHFFAYTDTIYLVDHIYTGLFHLSLFLVVYVNLYLLIPRLLNVRRFLLYGISTLVLLILACWINHFTFSQLSDWFFPNYFFIPYYSFSELMVFMAIYWLISTLIVLSQSWFKLKATEQHLTQTEHEKIKAELAMLKAQVNPHFLFNSLHNIYAMTLEEDPRSSDVILLLSDVLRYTLYEAKGDRVLLKKELKCLEQYLDIQRLRMPDINISYDVQGMEDDRTIAPLLLLPLIENAFKHGNVNQDSFYISIDIRLKNNTLEVVVKNSVESQKENDMPQLGGIGLHNLQRRLQLLYPQKHQLVIKCDPAFFQVNLSIDINPHEN